MPLRSGHAETIKTISMVLCMLLMTTIVMSSQALAAKLPEPEGQVILTVSGRLSNHNGAGEARFDRRMLEAIGTKTLISHTLYSEDASVWRGILMRDLLKVVGAKGDEIEFIAYDDYRVVVPIDDYYQYDVLLAFEQNGEKLSIRSRGPTRIIYPHDHHEDLHDKKYGSRYVWQIRKMIVR